MTTRERESEIFDKMALALSEYIKSMGGTALVVGDVSVGKDFQALEYNYFVQIRITGRMPTKTRL